MRIIRNKQPHISVICEQYIDHHEKLLPSNDVKLNFNFFRLKLSPFEWKILGIWRVCLWSGIGGFHLIFFFEKVLLGLASLFHIQIKSPKTVYLPEQCQLTSHKNSVHSVERGTKCQKRHVHCIKNWQCTLLCKNMPLQHIYTFVDWMQYKWIIVRFIFVQNALLKGSYSYANVDLDPLFVSVNALW